MMASFISSENRLAGCFPGEISCMIMRLSRGGRFRHYLLLHMLATATATYNTSVYVVAFFEC